MRVLVTGASGFIGWALCTYLIPRGWEVHGTQRRPGDLPAGVLPHQGDLSDLAWVQALFTHIRPDVVVHLAAAVDVSREVVGFSTRYLATLVPALQVLEVASLTSTRRLVMVGTCEEYGNGPAPFREDQAPCPVSAYSAAKTAVTRAALMLHQTRGLPVVVVRPFLTYGPGLPPGRMIADCIHAARQRRPFEMTPGDQTRDLVYVDDVCRGLVAAMITPGVEGQIFNLASGREVGVGHLAEQIYGRLGADPALVLRGALPYRPGEVMQFYGDPHHAAVSLDWRVEVSLEEGLKRTIEGSTMGWDPGSRRADGRR